MEYINYDGELQKAGKSVNFVGEIYAMGNPVTPYSFLGYRPDQTNPVTYTTTGYTESPLVGPIYVPAIQNAHIALLTGNDDRVIGSQIPMELSYELYDNDFMIKPGKLPSNRPEVHRELVNMRGAGWDILCAGWTDGVKFLLQSVTSFPVEEKYAYGIHQTVIAATKNRVTTMDTDSNIVASPYATYILINAKEESNLEGLCQDLHTDWRNELFSNDPRDIQAVLSALLTSVVSETRAAYMIRFRTPEKEVEPSLFDKARNLFKRDQDKPKYNEFGFDENAEEV